MGAVARGWARAVDAVWLQAAVAAATFANDLLLLETSDDGIEESAPERGGGRPAARASEAFS